MPDGGGSSDLSAERSPRLSHKGVNGVIRNVQVFRTLRNEDAQSLGWRDTLELSDVTAFHGIPIRGCIL